MLLISQCDKRALTETRRILDQFAERRGDRTWQTPITQEGLDTLHRLLRKTARKNTAIACHWIRGLDHSELLWIVGDRGRFNEQGAVPTNTTQRNVLRRQDENDWHAAELIRLLADLAGLLHDLGKATRTFQERLGKHTPQRNWIRHEWVSLRLFEAFVGDDDDAVWLKRLAAPSAEDDERWEAQLLKDGVGGAKPASPFKRLAAAPLAQALGWLVVTHHRLPMPPDKAALPTVASMEGLLSRIMPDWNESNFSQPPDDPASCWTMADALPVKTKVWRERASRIARRLLELQQRGSVVPPLDNPFVMHLSRLCLMLADHHYSRLEGQHPERIKVEVGNQLWANTRRSDGGFNQPLDEHLVGVARHGAEIARFLPRFHEELPHLGRVRNLRRRATHDAFFWQNRAADLARATQERSVTQGAFIINMASTGCGKTLANARMMDALADPARGMRCVFATGLRTLTLQTGQAFRQRLGLDESQLAIRVGGAASRALFEYHEQQAEQTGSASSRDLLEEEGSAVLFEGDTDHHPLLRRALADPDVRKLLLAPVLVCTIDHLVPATESQRGGRQIAPMLRLLSGDLVLDELDDFGLEDLPALTRLVHWAGLLGSRVLLSSATLPPALVQGLFEAYRHGRHHYQRNCSPRPGDAEAPPAVCCAWVDEFHQHQADHADPVEFEQSHLRFVARRRDELARQARQPRRRVELLDVPQLPPQIEAQAKALAPLLLQAAARLHGDHAVQDPRTGKRVSFGLIRMANIEPLFEVALALYAAGAPQGMRIHLCTYHSRHPLLVRSAIERQLDASLRRHEPEAVFALPDIRSRLDASVEADHLFIVLGSPVTEVGRDHDYDWAIVEPSSMRSLIQLLGRVRRHRPGEVSSPNVLVLSKNLRHFRHANSIAFCRPGFESERFRLRSHDLKRLLRPDEMPVIDARPRIAVPEALEPARYLTDLEHARLHDMMLPRADEASGSNASTWWYLPARDVLTTAVLPQRWPFRKPQGLPEVTGVLVPDEEEELHFYLSMEKGESAYARSDHLLRPEKIEYGPCIEPWATVDYLDALRELAEAHAMSLVDCAKRFGAVDLPDDEERSGWRYHPALGFARRRAAS